MTEHSRNKMKSLLKLIYIITDVKSMSKKIEKKSPSEYYVVLGYRVTLSVYLYNYPNKGEQAKALYIPSSQKSVFYVRNRVILESTQPWVKYLRLLYAFPQILQL